jgi:hypothetical protein
MATLRITCAHFQKRRLPNAPLRSLSKTRLICAACSVVLFGAHDQGAHDPHTHQDHKSGPPQARIVTVASTTSNLDGAVTIWNIVPGTSKWFRIIPPST